MCRRAGVHAAPRRRERQGRGRARAARRRRRRRSSRPRTATPPRRRPTASRSPGAPPRRAPAGRRRYPRRDSPPGTPASARRSGTRCRARAGRGRRRSAGRARPARRLRRRRRPYGRDGAGDNGDSAPRDASSGPVYGPAWTGPPYNLPVVAKPALTADEAAPVVGGTKAPAASGAVEDIRSTRPAVLTRSALRLSLRRAASIGSLVFLDVSGLALGLYVALVLRWLYYQHTVLWGVPWKAETKWLPFLILITLLVFWRNGLYAEREFRGGVGRIVSSLVLVTVLTLAFGLGTGYPFHTFGLAPTALVIITALIGLFRASYDVVTKDVLRLPAWLDELPAVLERTPVDELIVTDSDFEERELLEIVEHAHRRGVKVRVAPKTTELLTQRAEYVPGQGVPLFELRPPAFAAAQWAAKRAFDILIGATIVVVGLPVWIAIAAAVKLSSRGPVFYRDRRVGLGEREFGMLKVRTMYADAAERQDALEAANEAHGPLFKLKNAPRVPPTGPIP